MPRARARISAIVLGAVLGPALGCTFIVQFDDPDDADAGVVGDATTGSKHVDAGHHADAGSGPETGDDASPDDAANDDAGGDDDQADAAVDASPGRPDAGTAVIYANTPPNSVTLGAPSCDPCTKVTAVGWRCADSIPGNQCTNQGLLLVYCRGDGGATLATQACGNECEQMGTNLAGICNPCSGQPPSESICVPLDDDANHPAYSISCDSNGDEFPNIPATKVCNSSDCMNGCTAP